MPPYTANGRVQSLEEQLGARLLQWSTRKLSLTTADRHFYQSCATCVDYIDHAYQVVSDS